jgi:hypothetical protein
VSDIPLARGLVADVASTLKAAGQATEAAILERAVALMTRRPPARRRAPVRSAAVSAEDAAAIRAYAHSHPSASLHAIAQMFGTNPGRISEAMQGDR